MNHADGSAERAGPEAIVLLLAVVPFLVLLDGFDFVNLDDATAIYQNPHFRGLSMSHLQWMFTTPHMGHYQPLTWVSLGLDFSLFGMDPGGYHLTNMLLHWANSYLVFVLFTHLLARVSGATNPRIRWAAAFGALVFAVHPLRVESVAWVTERRDVLSGFFYVLALIFYVRRGDSPAPRASYLYCLLFFVLSMFSKAWGVTFVAVLLLIDVYPLRRFATGDWRRIIQEKVPFLVISIVFGFLASWAQTESGAMKSFADYGILQRAAQAAYGLCFYVVVTVWPIGLYPMHELDVHLDPLSAVYLLCFAAVASVSIALVVFRRRVPWLAVSWFVYACVVAPVLGFAQSGPQMVADRYTYLPCLPFALLAAGGFSWATHRSGNRRGPWIVALVVVALLSTMTFRQLQVWRNSVSLWEHTVQLDAKSHVSLFNLAKAYEDQKRYDDSIRYLRLALAVQPDAVDPRFNLGILLAEQKKDYATAIVEFGRLLRYKPDHAVAQYCIGLSEAKLHRDPRAIRSYLAAVRLDPGYLPAHRALVDAYMRAGDRVRASKHRRIASQLERR
jgi:protein O-mannosyl-transferase